MMLIYHFVELYFIATNYVWCFPPPGHCDNIQCGFPLCPPGVDLVLKPGACCPGCAVECDQIHCDWPDCGDAWPETKPAARIYEGLYCDWPDYGTSTPQFKPH
ncbi:hypothetical protein MAR_013766, partial [Mya arenaria]